MAKKMRLVHECCPQHLHTGTARMKQGKEAKEQGKQRREKMKKSKPGEK